MLERDGRSNLTGLLLHRVPSNHKSLNVTHCSHIGYSLVVLLIDKCICLRGIMWSVLLDRARTSGSGYRRRHNQSKMYWLRVDLVWCRRIFELSVNVRQVSNQFVVVSSERRMGICVLDQRKLCVDRGNTLKGF